VGSSGDRRRVAAGNHVSGTLATKAGGTRGDWGTGHAGCGLTRDAGQVGGARPVKEEMDFKICLIHFQ
jgi:hypothetical protein